MIILDTDVMIDLSRRYPPALSWLDSLGKEGFQMKKETLISVIIFLVIGLITVSCASIQPAPDVKVELTEERIALGKYLVEGPTACGYCHTPGAFFNDPIEEKHLSGGKIEDSNFTAYSANITPDVETGIGGWTDGEIIRAIREGVNKDDKTLFLLMPYIFYKDMLSSLLCSGAPPPG